MNYDEVDAQDQLPLDLAEKTLPAPKYKQSIKFRSCLLAVIGIDSLRVTSFIRKSLLQDSLESAVRVGKHGKMSKINSLFSYNQHSMKIGGTPVILTPMTPMIPMMVHIV